MCVLIEKWRVQIRTLSRFLACSACILTPVSLLAASLTDEINYTLETNPDVLIRIHQQFQQKERVYQKFSEFLPNVNITALKGPENSLNFTTGQVWARQTKKNTTATLVENIFNGMQSYYGVKQNNAQLDSANSETGVTSEDTAYAVAEVYLTALENQKLVQIAKENVAVHLKTFSLIGKRTNLGLASKSEKALTRGRYAVARINQDRAIKTQKDFLATYIKIVGRPAKNLHIPKSKLPYTRLSNAAAIKVALANNPAMQKARQDITAAVDAYKASRGTFAPSVDIVLSRVRGENLGGLAGPEYTDSAVIEASYNFLNGGKDVATIKEKAYARREAYDQLERTHREVVERMRLAQIELHNARIILPKLKTHVDKTSYVLNAYKQQYAAGKRTLLDVLNIENELYRARQNYIAGLYNLKTSEYLVLNRMGLLTTALKVHQVVTRKITLPYVK
ncbi:MAG: TolC family protein [Coxiellaceae bacterium]|nr:TolC family protein [Coxiellaceae bacterium]